MTLEKQSYENFVVEEEKMLVISNSLFSIMFSALLRTYSTISASFTLSSGNAFKFWAEILLFDKELISVPNVTMQIKIRLQRWELVFGWNQPEFGNIVL